MEIAKLERTPKIVSKLDIASKKLDEILASLDIENMVATEATKKSLKTVHSQLVGMEIELETSRKGLYKALLAEYSEMIPIYNEKLLVKILNKKAEIKKKVIFVEDAQRKEKKDELVEIYKAHCEFNDIDFVEFEDVGLKINISSSNKKLAEQLNEYFFNMVEEIDSINALSNSTDVMVEYRKCKNFAQSVKIVSDREAAKKAVVNKKAEINVTPHIKVEDIKAVKVEPVGMVKLYVKTNASKWNGLKEYMRVNGIEFGKL